MFSGAHSSAVEDLDADFLIWFDRLQEIAKPFRERVLDMDAWQPEWEAGKSAEDAFFAEFPEHAVADADDKSCQKQHTAPCGECPFRRKSAPGWLGASNPGEFLALADSEHRTPCHERLSYDEPGWEEKAKTSPQCVGRSIFLANRAKLAGPHILRAKPDSEAVFTRPHEFVAHHAHLDPKTLETTLVYELYAIGNSPKKG